MVPTATGKLRELQLTLAEMLKVFRDICDKHNLRYFLDFGTLLGAVRHQGFIPWDDDIDVTMPYEDYCKFLEIAQEELGDQYFLQSVDTEKYFHQPIARIRKNGTTHLYLDFKHWGVHQGVWLDIFPIIDINSESDRKIKRKFLKLAILLISDFMFRDKSFFKHDKISSKIIIYLIRMLHILPLSFRKKINNHIINHIAAANKNKKNNKAVIWLDISKCYPKDIYNSSTKLIFEGEEYSAPAQYDKKLTIEYGDYMQLPPEEQRVGHSVDVILDLEKDYTFYTK